MRTVKKRLEPNKDDASDQFSPSQASSYEAIFMPNQSTVGGTVQLQFHLIQTRKLRTFAQTPLGYGLYSLFLNQVRSLIESLFYPPPKQNLCGSLAIKKKKSRTAPPLQKAGKSKIHLRVSKFQGLPAVFLGRSECPYGYIGACTSQENFIRKKKSQFWTHFSSIPYYQFRTFFV